MWQSDAGNVNVRPSFLKEGRSFIARKKTLGKREQMCYNTFEVRKMDEQQNTELPQEEESGYVPRPQWQVWVARIGLVLFLIVVALYYVNLFRGGV